MMRRELILGLGAMLSMLQPSQGRLACQNLAYGMRVCTAGIELRATTAFQQMPHWCWAACIESIFQFHGHRVAQGRIVERVFAGEIDQAAIGPQIISAIDGQWEDDDGETFDASAEVLWDAQFGLARPDAIVQAARELESDNPLILGALGHAVLLTALTYSWNGASVQINQAVVRDPWPLNPNRRILTPMEAMQTQFLAKVEVS